MQESSSKIPFSQVQTLELNNSLKYPDFRNSRFSPEPDCRPTLPPVDRSVDWVPNRELGTYSQVLPVDRAADRVPNRELGTYSQGLRSTDRSTAFWSCARCACRSTDQPVFCCCCYFLLLFSFAFIVDFLGDHLDDPWQSIVKFLCNNLSFQHLTLLLAVQMPKNNWEYSL